jgi:hypothetical protein
MDNTLNARFQELLQKITGETATKKEELEFFKTFNTELEKIEKAIINNRAQAQQ